jgi:DNA modification methylase
LLEHLGSPVDAIREIQRVTRPGGFAVVCSPDWDEFKISPCTPDVEEAISAYRELQESNGGNTHAGAYLRIWLQQAGFTPLAHEEWQEEYEDPSEIGEYLAVQLENHGEAGHAQTLREWATHPFARFRLTWKYATAVRADIGKLHKSVTE